MVILFGAYGTGRKMCAYRRAWCNHCAKEAIAEQYSAFYFFHVFFIPLIPLGTRWKWECRECRNDPLERTHESVWLLKFARVFFGLIFLWSLVGIAMESMKDKEARKLWFVPFIFLALSYFVHLRLRSGTAEPPKRQVVEPLNNANCLYCNGPIQETPRPVCQKCGLFRM